MRQRVFHRGVTIDNPTGEPGHWQAKVQGHDVKGELDAIKKSIDWSTEMRTFISPEQVANQVSAKVTKEKPQQKTDVHLGFKIINDSGKDNEWYLIIKGQLLKGSLPAVKAFLDKNIDKIKA